MIRKIVFTNYFSEFIHITIKFRFQKVSNVVDKIYPVFDFDQIKWCHIILMAENQLPSENAKNTYTISHQLENAPFLWAAKTKISRI